MTHGCRVPLDVWGDILVDGHNRHTICQKHGLPFQTKQVTFADRTEALLWIIRNQLDRRNIAEFVRFELKDKEAEILKEAGKEKQRTYYGNQYDRPLKDESGLLSTVDKSPLLEPIPAKQPEKHDTRKVIADNLGWSTGKVAMAQKVKKVAAPEIHQKLRQGEMSINEAHKQIRKEERREGQATKEQALFDATTHAKEDALWTLTSSPFIRMCKILQMA